MNGKSKTPEAHAPARWRPLFGIHRRLWWTPSVYQFHPHIATEWQLNNGQRVVCRPKGRTA